MIYVLVILIPFSKQAKMNNQSQNFHFISL